MADILELALRRVTENGMSPAEGAAMLERFMRGEGRDIGWKDIVPRLPQAIAERIDRKAVGWMLVQRKPVYQTIEEPKPEEWLPYKDA
jgi:hypothetical protein